MTEGRSIRSRRRNVWSIQSIAVGASADAEPIHPSHRAQMVSAELSNQLVCRIDLPPETKRTSDRVDLPTWAPDPTAFQWILDSGPRFCVI